MKIVHIMSQSIFAKGYIEFIEENFDINDHDFIVFDNKINDSRIIPIFNKVQIIKIFFKLKKYDKIILHGFFRVGLLETLILFNTKISKKMYWLIWGQDLYAEIPQYSDPPTSQKKTLIEIISQKLKRMIKKRLIRKFTGIIGMMQGDYEVAVKCCHAKATFFPAVIYPKNYIQKLKTSVNCSLENLIQVGNSPSPNNHHQDSFNLLKNMDLSSYQVFCPLAYGDKDRILKLCTEGKELFGERFFPLTTLLPLSDYTALLERVKVALFNNRYQESVGNISLLLAMGKTIYLRNDTSVWKFCCDQKLIARDIADLEKTKKFEFLSPQEAALNIDTIMRFFAIDRIKSDWNKIFCA